MTGSMSLPCPSMSCPDAPLLTAEGLAVSLSDAERRFRLELSGLSLTPGQAVGITGPSGTGKTLMLEVLGLLRAPDPGGRYLLADGRDLTALWQGRRAGLAALRGETFGFVPQTGGLMPFLTVTENVALSQRVVGREDPARVADLLAALGLSHVAGAHPAILSIGQRQRVAIARALAHRPRVVIADEPTAALDPASAADAMALLLDRTAADGAALILSSHDHGLLERVPLTRYALAIAETEGTIVSQLSRVSECV